MHVQIWQEAVVCGILRNPSSLGMNWWYRIQLTDNNLAPEHFEQLQVFGRPICEYAQTWSDLYNGMYHIVWKPQWVPARSISWELRRAFWERMPPRFWVLSRPLEDNIIWREEEEQYINLSRQGSEHLCAREDCQSCRTG